MINPSLVLSGVLWLGMALAGAQAPDVRGQQQAATAPPKEGETVTIVGCLVQGDPARPASQQVADASPSSASDYFVRTPVVQVPVGTTVTIGGSGAATAAKTTLYRVLGLDGDELRPHRGHRVEVQGHLRTDDAAVGVTAKTTVDAAGRATTKVERRMDLAGVLHATAIRMLSESCE